MPTQFWLENLKERDVYYVKMDLTGIWLEGVDWVYLAQYRDQWLTIVNAVMSHKKQGISWLAEGLSASQEGPSSIG
jgi:hypothetical protein